MAVKNNELIVKTLDYIFNIQKNTQNYIKDIRVLVQQAYLEGKTDIEAKQIKQKFVYLSIKDIRYMTNISKRLISILPSEKVTFKGKFQQIIYKLAVVKEIFDHLQKYLQHEISLQKLAKIISDVSSKVITNMQIKKNNLKKQNSEISLDIREVIIADG